MGRTPCCEKKGVKKGSWTAEEDEILISYIQRCGHSNWRALPKQAGLLRCGKSCRLRWNNYLRPDIKRGNFSVDEENTIMKMHEMIGNRWSTIAAKLPGRTDNEIKNHWRSHLKKRLLMISTSKEETVESSSSMGVKKEAESESEGSINAVRLKDGIQNTVTSVELLNEDFWAEMLSESSLSSEVQVQSSSPSLSDVTTFSHSYWSREDDSLDYYILG